MFGLRCRNQRDVLLLVIAAAGLALSCRAPQTGYRGLNSPSPLDRAQSAVELAEAGDPEAVHKLVDLLDDSDAGVRLYAILALRKLCGVDYGYHYYEDRGARAAAIERWRAAARAGELRVVPPHRGPDRGAATRAADAGGLAGDAP